MGEEHPKGDGRVREVGIPQAEAQVLADVCVQVQLPLLRQLQDGQGRELFGDRRDPEAGVLRKRAVQRGVLRVDVAASEELAVGPGPVLVDDHAEAGDAGPLRADHGVQRGVQPRRPLRVEGRGEGGKSSSYRPGQDDRKNR